MGDNAPISQGMNHNECQSLKVSLFSASPVARIGHRTVLLMRLGEIFLGASGKDVLSDKKTACLALPTHSLPLNIAMMPRAQQLPCNHELTVSAANPQRPPRQMGRTSWVLTASLNG